MTISMDDDLADIFDKFMQDKGYTSRSEAIRDPLRGEIGREGVEEGTARECVGTLSYVYTITSAQLASRLASMHHDHHDVAVSAMHVHLDHDNCLETVIVRGPTKAVLKFADCVIRGERCSAWKDQCDSCGRRITRAHARERPRSQAHIPASAHLSLTVRSPPQCA